MIIDKWKKWNIENIAMIVIKHLAMNQISALNNPQGVDLLFTLTPKKIFSRNDFPKNTKDIM